jgi:hypothetical protein
MNGIEIIIAIVISGISVVLGWYGREVLDKRIQNKRRRRVSNKQKEVREGAATWLVEYYIEAGEGERLFTLPNGKKIPYLSRAEWQASNPSGLSLKYSIGEEQSNVSVDKSAISYRKLIGQRLWDGPVLCLSGVVCHGDRFELVLRRCSYFQYATIEFVFKSWAVGSRRKALRDSIDSSDGLCRCFALQAAIAMMLVMKALGIFSLPLER